MAPSSLKISVTHWPWKGLSEINTELVSSMAISPSLLLLFCLVSTSYGTRFHTQCMCLRFRIAACRQLVSCRNRQHCTILTLVSVALFVLVTRPLVDDEFPSVQPYVSRQLDTFLVGLPFWNYLHCDRKRLRLCDDTEILHVLVTWWSRRCDVALFRDTFCCLNERTYFALVTVFKGKVTNMETMWNVDFTTDSRNVGHTETVFN